MNISGTTHDPLQVIRQTNKAGSQSMSVKRLVEQVDRETNVMKNPEITKNLEVFPNYVHMSNTAQAMKLLDVI